MNALGIDIGGSAIKGAPVDTKTGKLLEERHRIEVDKDMPPARMAKVVGEIAEHFKWRGPIGVGFPGVIEGATIWTSANLHEKFVGCDGAQLFGKATGCRVAMINDAAAAGVAEMRFGAGEDFMGKALLLTLGTGVGSCLAYQGVVVPLELGHFPWKNDKSAEKYVAASVREDKDLSWEDWGGRLCDYVTTLESLIWPELIIVGGGVSAKHEKFFPYIKSRAKLVPARFLNQAGIAGAAMWAVEAK
ncbi:polyphosphate--glucose phosphotransferase [Horticoccus sp. 23ND18S-11]|uniref:polyphosphate--glucose phosphotransferase n=1 Tax=Horticoccus sp. 23ND18S-11 TaxID=3391832 RepID=UPI0039C98FFA